MNKLIFLLMLVLADTTWANMADLLSTARAKGYDFSLWDIRLETFPATALNRPNMRLILKSISKNGSPITALAEEKFSEPNRSPHFMQQFTDICIDMFQGTNPYNQYRIHASDYQFTDGAGLQLLGCAFDQNTKKADERNWSNEAN